MKKLRKINICNKVNKTSQTNKTNFKIMNFKMKIKYALKMNKI